MITKKVKIDEKNKFSEEKQQIPAEIDINNSGEVRDYIRNMRYQQAYSQNLANLGKVKTTLPEIEMAVTGKLVNNQSSQIHASLQANS